MWARFDTWFAILHCEILTADLPAGNPGRPGSDFSSSLSPYRYSNEYVVLCSSDISSHYPSGEIQLYAQDRQGIEVDACLLVLQFHTSPPLPYCYEDRAQKQDGVSMTPMVRSIPPLS